MCGIAGKLSFDRSTPVDPELIRRMTAVIAHRGPDDEGVWTDGPVALGNRRLAVIDLSPCGHQPMSNEDGSLWIAFNGEIYNFQELRQGLLQRGHRFHSHTDTETILHLFEEQGTATFSHLRGMFALAIWDRRTETLILARDRIGKKPLFYHQSDRGLVFGSEVKSILQDPDVDPQPDIEAIDHYLTYGYIPAPHSAFQGIRKLPPGHWMKVHKGSAEISRYWQLRYSPKRRVTEDAAVEELGGILTEATRLRMISDVPLGVLLSGGLDSSAVVATMRAITSGPIRTFSIGFDRKEYDELEYARLVARHFDTDHRDIVVKPDAVALVPRLAWHYNEPFADSSAVPSFAVCELARRHVTVALNGDGGDESFAGYDRYVAAGFVQRLARLPRIVRSAGASASRLVPAGTPKSTAYRIRRVLGALPQAPIEQYAGWVAVFRPGDQATLYSGELAQMLARTRRFAALEEAVAASDASEFVERILGADVHTYLPGDLLVKMDIASMANSLEVRSPFLDHVLMEFAASLPLEFKLKGRSQKHILKRLMEPQLPAAILSRPKMGFGVPIDSWFRHELRDMAYDILLDTTARSRGLFQPEAVRRLLDEHTAGTAHHHHRLWALLMLETWFRLFIDRRCPSDAASACAAIGNPVFSVS